MQNHPYRVKWEWFIILLAIWNSITLPIEIAFETDFFQATYTQVGNHIIDGFFILDIILTFRTSYQNIHTGDEITNSKLIAINYMCGRFWIDLISAIPFEVVPLLFVAPEQHTFVNDLKFITILKLFRVLRLERIINYMNTTDENKLSLRLIKLCFFLLLYIHISACFWFYLGNIDQAW